MAAAEDTLVVIEDDHHISDLVAMYLRRDGFRVLQADDGEAGLELVAREHPKLVIVDIGLPGRLDGFDICRRLGNGSQGSSGPQTTGTRAPGTRATGTRATGARATGARTAAGTTPVLILSARDDEVDRVLGLELGADDYVTKPFSARELVARVHAILRRTGVPQAPSAPAVVELGAIEVDTGRREVRLEGTVVPLATREFELLAYLVDNLGLALSAAAAARRGVGRRLVRRRADRRRPRPPAAQEARGRPAAGHRLGPGLPVGMRRRLTTAILLLVAGTVLVTSVGSYFLIRRDAIRTSQQQLSGQAEAISKTFSGTTPITRASFRRELTVISDAGALAGIEVVALYPGGSVRGQLPEGVTTAMLDIPGLRAGRPTVGHTGSLLIYAAVPTPLTRTTPYLPVLVVTRQIHSPAGGLRYFALVAAIGLVLAALVAAALARRFTRPLVAAVAATRQIAAGDLDATIPVTPGEDPEFAQLAESINTMGANLVRARDQERQFLLSVSHELRTPLTSIRGYADAVIDGATDDPTAAARVISAEARRLERLVQDLLDLARLDADRFSLDVMTVDCSDVVRQVAEGFRPRARELGLELTVAPGSDVPLWVEADPDRLGQVVANLLENASSFAAQRVVVGVGTSAGRPAAWVVDDGPGIPADQLARVFERHFVSDRVSGRRQGSGLGLAIVSELASAMGASVVAESPVADGQGTRMVLWLLPPRRTADVPGGTPGGNLVGATDDLLRPAGAGPDPDGSSNG